jgi:AraC-like DNA-binding protein
MQKAMQLLQQRDKKLIDVARSVGYESDAAFSKAFKRVVGTSPVNTSNVVIKTEAVSEWRRYLKWILTLAAGLGILLFPDARRWIGP